MHLPIQGGPTVGPYNWPAVQPPKGPGPKLHPTAPPPKTALPYSGPSQQALGQKGKGSGKSSSKGGKDSSQSYGHGHSTVHPPANSAADRRHQKQESEVQSQFQVYVPKVQNFGFVPFWLKNLDATTQVYIRNSHLLKRIIQSVNTSDRFSFVLLTRRYCTESYNNIFSQISLFSRN